MVVKLKEAKQYLRDFFMVPGGVPAYEETDIMLGVRYADAPSGSKAPSGPG